MASNWMPKLAPKGITRPVRSILDLNVSSLPLAPSCSDGGSEDDSLPSAKRIKINLDPRERERRRKIRNRVASQTSRDKKKKQVEELEFRIAHLERLNLRLISENEQLRERTSLLEHQKISLWTNTGADVASHDQNVQINTSAQVSSLDTSTTSLATVRDTSLQGVVVAAAEEVSEEGLFGIGASRSAALGSVSLQQERPQSQAPLLLTASPTAPPPAHKKYPVLIKFLLMMSLIEYLPSSVIPSTKTLSCPAIRKMLLSRLTQCFSQQQLQALAVMQRPRKGTNHSNQHLLLSSLRWWKAHQKAWAPPKN